VGLGGFRGLCASFAVAAFLFGVAPAAHAQDEGPPAAAKGPIPPKVKKRVDPTYPPERLAKGEKATVKVELTIDAQGVVVDAKILEGAGPDFDAAALEAAKQLEFEPASAAGKPIAAKIAWRFSFDFADVAPPAAEPGVAAAEAPRSNLSALTGVVRTPLEDPLVGATVTIVGPNGARATTATDGTGRFAFRDLPPGSWQIRIETEGFQPFEATEEIGPGKALSTVYRPRLAGDAIDIDVRGERPPREVTVHTLEQRELTRIPGTNGDALRAIQNLPGVGRPPGLSGLLIIRGAAPNETNIFVDGTLVPIAYHFGGLSSVIPSELIEKIDFRPGNFGPEFGRVSGGIIDIGLKSPKKDRLHGLLQFDLIDGRTVVEGPIDDKTRFAVGARRSWVDAWLGPVLRQLGSGVSTAPVYYDYQAILERDLGANTTARVAFFGSSDALAITINTPSASDPTLGGDVSSQIGFWRLQGKTETRLSPDVKWTNVLAYGRDYVRFNVGDLLFDLDSNPLTWRSDMRAKISREASVIAGVDILWSSFDVRVKAPPPPLPGETPGPFFGRPPREISGAGALYRPAFYGLLDLAPIKGLKLLPGFRVDYSRDTQSWNLGPRFATRYDVVSGFPRTTLKGGIGVFYQPPQPQESIQPFGNSGLINARSTHYSAGFEQEFSKQIDLSIEGFYKDLQRLVLRQLAETSQASGVLYGNQGDGRVFGVEVLLRYKPDDRFFGWIAYTLSRSERRLQPDYPLTLFSFDQTHILTMLGSYKLGKGWEAGLRFRYVSGRMYTPNVGGVADFDSGSYAPIPEIPPFSSRLPAFHQLDVRIDKVWKFTHWQFSAYLDVLNVYNRANPEGIGYNYDFSSSNVISGVPILPVIGIRGEL
jgi:TonB family protein